HGSKVCFVASLYGIHTQPCSKGGFAGTAWPHQDDIKKLIDPVKFPELRQPLTFEPVPFRLVEVKIIVPRHPCCLGPSYFILALAMVGFIFQQPQGELDEA